MKLSRRHFMSGTAALAVSRALPPLALSPAFFAVSQTPASAAWPAVVAVAIQVYGALSAMNAPGSGLGDYLSAMNLKLDQVLANQKYILESIAQLQSSIDQLGKNIGGMLIEQRYIDVRDALENTNQQLTDLITDITEQGVTPAVQRTFRELASKFRNEAYEPGITLAGSRLTDEKAGKKGIDGVLAMTPALINIVRNLDLFRYLDGIMPQESKSDLSYKRLIERAQQAISQMRPRMQEALKVQIDDAKDALSEMVEKNTWTPYRKNVWGPLEDLFPYANQVADETVKTELCYQAPLKLYQVDRRSMGFSAGRSLGFSSVLASYRLLRTYPYQYQVQMIEGADPSFIYDAKLGGRRERRNEYIKRRLDKRFSAQKNQMAINDPRAASDRNQFLPPSLRIDFSLLRIPDEPNCRTGLLYGPISPVQSALGEVAFGDDRPFEEQFKKIIQWLPTYNNAVLYQGQIIKVGQIMDKLDQALLKLLNAVPAPRLPTPRP